MFDEIQKYINDCKTKYSRNMCIHLGIDLNICLDEHRDTLGDLVGPVGYSCEGRNTTHPRQAVACMLEFMQENTFTAVNTCDLEGDPSEAWTWSKSSGKKKQIDYVLSNHTSFCRGRPFTFFNNKGQWESNILNNSDHRLLVAEFRISASISHTMQLMDLQQSSTQSIRDGARAFPTISLLLRIGNLTMHVNTTNTNNQPFLGSTIWYGVVVTPLIQWGSSFSTVADQSHSNAAG